MRLSIMQPYFVPYAGYFRLFTTTDLFVLYDCVQFPRRSWVHRNQVLNIHNHPQWLTLPLAKCPQTTLIRNLSFMKESAASWGKRLLAVKGMKQAESLYSLLSPLTSNVVDYLESSLKTIASQLNIPCQIVRSSTLNLDPNLKGQDRILEICQKTWCQSLCQFPGRT